MKERQQQAKKWGGDDFCSAHAAKVANRRLTDKVNRQKEMQNKRSTKVNYNT